MDRRGGVIQDNIRYNVSRDGHSYKVTSAQTVGGRREPRTYAKASACISYYLDDNGNKVNATIFREPPTNKRARALKNIPTNRTITCADLAPVFAD